jgi:cholesterol transport system auxiliary component
MRLNYPLVAGAVLCLGACSIGRPIPTATTYSIEPVPATADARGPAHPETLRVGRVRVAAPYDRPSLIYRFTAVRYVSDPYHAFLSDPGLILGNRIATWLDQSGLFKEVAGPESVRSAPMVLEATVTELYGDFRQSAQPAAVMTVRFAIVDQVSAHPQIAYERTITRRIRLADASPDELVGGYDTALAEILSLLATDLSTQAAH